MEADSITNILTMTGPVGTALLLIWQNVRSMLAKQAARDAARDSRVDDLARAVAAGKSSLQTIENMLGRLLVIDPAVVEALGRTSTRPVNLREHAT